MIEAIDRYLIMKRVAGFNLKNTEYLLRSFGRFAGSRGETHIRASTVIGWASKATSVAQRHTRYQTVYRFASFVRLEDEEHEMPPPNYFGYQLIRRIPHIYSAAEIERLLHAARQLRPIGSLRPLTYATLISLLVATGLRISEALQLRISDVRPDGLLIRKTKFQKSRLVPLHSTAVAGLRYYLAQRQKLHSGGEHVLVSRNGNRFVYGTVQSAFRTLLTSAGLASSQGRRPRLHDFRHTFAVRALESSPTGRRRIGRHMVALATYLGHVNIDATYWYLTATPDLLNEIATASATFLDGVSQ